MSIATLIVCVVCRRHPSNVLEVVVLQTLLFETHLREILRIIVTSVGASTWPAAVESCLKVSAHWVTAYALYSPSGINLCHVAKSTLHMFPFLIFIARRVADRLKEGGLENLISGVRYFLPTNSGHAADSGAYRFGCGVELVVARNRRVYHARSARGTYPVYGGNRLFVVSVAGYVSSEYESSYECAANSGSGERRAL